MDSSYKNYIITVNKVTLTLTRDRHVAIYKV